MDHVLFTETLSGPSKSAADKSGFDLHGQGLNHRAVRRALYRCWGGNTLYLIDGIEPSAPPEAVDVERATRLERGQVLSILSALVPPIDRCLAAAPIDLDLLTEVVSRPHAINMRCAGTRIDATLHQTLRERRAPFAVLFRIYALPSVELQAEEVELWKRREAKPRKRTLARDKASVARLVSRLGARKVRRLVNDSAARARPRFIAPLSKGSSLLRGPACRRSFAPPWPLLL